MTKKRKKPYRGFIRIDATKEIYQVCEISIDKKEITLSLLISHTLHLI